MVYNVTMKRKRTIGTRISITFQEDMYADLEKLAIEEGRPLASLVRWIVGKYIYPKKEKK